MKILKGKNDKANTIQVATVFLKMG